MNLFNKPMTPAQVLMAALGEIGGHLARRTVKRASRKRHPVMVTASDKEIADWNAVITMAKKARAQRRMQRDAEMRQMQQHLKTAKGVPVHG